MEELFATMKARVLEGMVFHDEMSRYFSFLGLKGYAKCHEYHYAEETLGYKKLSRFYLDHYNKLIPTKPMDRPNVIPDNWYGVNQMKVDRGTKQSSIMKSFEKWIEWETETLATFSDLKNQADAVTCPLVDEFIKDVSDELCTAKRKYMELESIGYDLIAIYSKQDDICEMYSRKIKKLF